MELQLPATPNFKNVQALKSALTKKVCGGPVATRCLSQIQIGQFHQQRVKNSWELIKSRLLEGDKAWRSQERGEYPTSVCSSSMVWRAGISPTLLWFFSMAYILGISKGNPSRRSLATEQSFNKGLFIYLEDVCSSKTRNTWVQEQDPGQRLQVQGYAREFSGQGKVTQATLTWPGYFWELCTQEGLLKTEAGQSHDRQPYWATPTLKAIRPWPQSSGMAPIQQGYIQREELEWAEPPSCCCQRYICALSTVALVVSAGVGLMDLRYRSTQSYSESACWAQASALQPGQVPWVRGWTEAVAMLLKILKAKPMLVTCVCLQSPWVRSSLWLGDTHNVNHKGQWLFLPTHKLPLDFVSDVIARCPMFLNLTEPYNFYSTVTLKETMVGEGWTINSNPCQGFGVSWQVFHCICIQAAARKSMMLSHPFRNGRAIYKWRFICVRSTGDQL